MEEFDNDWHGPMPPDKDDIDDAWGQAYELAVCQFQQWLPESKQRLHTMIKTSKLRDFVLRIITVKQLRDEARIYQRNSSTNIPSFERETEPIEGVTEEGDIVLDDADILEPDSVLALEMGIKRHQRVTLDAGIVHRETGAILLPPSLAMKVVYEMTFTNRRALAEILLFQLAKEISEDRENDLEDATDLAGIIDNYLNISNVREFYARIAGTE